MSHQPMNVDQAHEDGDHSMCMPSDCMDALCNYQVGGGTIGGWDYNPPEYCEREVEPYSDKCAIHNYDPLDFMD